MNYKIAKTMLVLCVVYLIGFYMLKFIFPELLIQTITSPTILKLGEFVDSNKLTYHLLRIATAYITYLLFVCACTGRPAFKLKDQIFILGGVAIAKIVLELMPELYTHTSISIMLLLSLLCCGDLFKTTITFVLHGFLSQFLASIRGIETVFIHINSMSGLLLNLEAYVWLVLLAIIFYIKRREKNGRICTSVSQQAHGTIKEEL